MTGIDERSMWMCTVMNIYSSECTLGIEEDEEEDCATASSGVSTAIVEI